MCSVHSDAIKCFAQANCSWFRQAQPLNIMSAQPVSDETSYQIDKMLRSVSTWAETFAVRAPVAKSNRYDLWTCRDEEKENAASRMRLAALSIGFTSKLSSPGLQNL
jgi:hypothetical protein